LGIEQLAKQLAGKVSVVAGPSGAGKSSLINALRLGRHKPEAGGVGVQDAAAAAAGVQWQYGVDQQQQELDHWGHESSSDSSVCSSSGQEESDQCEPSSSSSSSSSVHLPGGTASSNGSSSSSSDRFLAVGDVSRIGRGRHTTRTVTLIELPFGGLMADTPGFNQPTLDRVSSAELAGLFPEFLAAQEAAGGCRWVAVCTLWFG
jgi:energy-coupling factor transporter ATP-binding protein EcfA2